MNEAIQLILTIITICAAVVWIVIRIFKRGSTCSCDDASCGHSIDSACKDCPLCKHCEKKSDR